MEGGVGWGDVSWKLGRFGQERDLRQHSCPCVQKDKDV